MERSLESILNYHELSKHSPARFSAGPRFLDWASQPAPFRRYQGAWVTYLELVPDEHSPPLEGALYHRATAPAPFDFRTLSQFFQDSLALSAWKTAGQSRWPLRMNPSSGNLHPTEAFFFGPLGRAIALAHYAPDAHALEVRGQLPLSEWGEFPQPLLFIVALTSIYWREAWKYGERAFRYCNLDIGHALGALAAAGAALGWHVRLLPASRPEAVAALVGLAGERVEELHVGECFAAVSIEPLDESTAQLIGAALERLAPALTFAGTANDLSPEYTSWPEMAAAVQATRVGPRIIPPPDPSPDSLFLSPRGAEPALRAIIHQRRSAPAFDPARRVSQESFRCLLERTLARASSAFTHLVTFAPRVHLAIFVHAVQELESGLYLFLRSENALADLRKACREEFLWHRLGPLPLYLLARGDLRDAAGTISCYQEIAAQSCFSLAMIAEFLAPLERYGPWYYRTLLWECGVLGQLLYLEAEAAGLRGTGIGCFFDDAMHRHTLGIADLRYQSLYHFTIGHPLEDPRLHTEPPYSGER